MEKKLYKSESNKMLEGVCGGIGEYFSIDPTIVRLLWAFFSLMAGTGILAYIIAAIVIPKAPSNDDYVITQKDNDNNNSDNNDNN